MPQNDFKLLNGFQRNSHNIIGWNPLMVIPLLANQDLMPMLRTYELLAMS